MTTTTDRSIKFYERAEQLVESRLVRAQFTQSASDWRRYEVAQEVAATLASKLQLSAEDHGND
jgi:hypothetical protein